MSILVEENGMDDRCQICGDVSSGWYCGVFTCEACRKFFLRSLKMGQEWEKKYACIKDRCCVITKQSRTECQYCRFAKCLSVGMAVEKMPTREKDLYKRFPCLICGASASGIHFGVVTCEGCKAFFRRSIQEKFLGRYQCLEKNPCEVLACRSCRLQKCLQMGMSTEASRVGRQSNRFKECIRKIQSGSETRGTVSDSMSLVSIAKRTNMKRMEKTSHFSMDSLGYLKVWQEIPVSITKLIDHVHQVYLKYLKVMNLIQEKLRSPFSRTCQTFPRCTRYDDGWMTMTRQWMAFTHRLHEFCRRTLLKSIYSNNSHGIIASTIHCLLMITREQGDNYWRADKEVIDQIHQYSSSWELLESQFGSYSMELQRLNFDDKEFSLFIFTMITQTNVTLFDQEQQRCWSHLRWQALQALQRYRQVRRFTVEQTNLQGLEEIIQFISHLLVWNRYADELFCRLPWPSLLHLPPLLRTESFSENASHQLNRL